MGSIPSFLVYQHLYDWFQGNIVHVDLDFNLDDVPHNDFETRLNGMLDTFEGRLQEYVNFYLNFFDTGLLRLDGPNL
jgi:hypothetical protein